MEENEVGMQIRTRGGEGPERRMLGRGLEGPTEQMPQQGQWAAGLRGLSLSWGGVGAQVTGAEELPWQQASGSKGATEMCSGRAARGAARGPSRWEWALRASLEEPIPEARSVCQAPAEFATLCGEDGPGNRQSHSEQEMISSHGRRTHMYMSVRAHTHPTRTHTCAHAHLDKVNTANLGELQNHHERFDNGPHDH